MDITGKSYAHDIVYIIISGRPVNVNIITVARKGDFRFGRPVGSYMLHVEKGRVDG